MTIFFTSLDSSSLCQSKKNQSNEIWIEFQQLLVALDSQQSEKGMNEWQKYKLQVQVIQQWLTHTFVVASFIRPQLIAYFYFINKSLQKLHQSFS